MDIEGNVENDCDLRDSRAKIVQSKLCFQTVVHCAIQGEDVEAMK